LGNRNSITQNFCRAFFSLPLFLIYLVRKIFGHQNAKAQQVRLAGKIARSRRSWEENHIHLSHQAWNWLQSDAADAAKHAAKHTQLQEEEDITTFQPHQADYLDTTCVKGHRGTQHATIKKEGEFYQSTFEW